MQQLGISTSDLYGRKCWDISDDPHLVRSTFAACMLDRESQDLRHRMRLPDGRSFPSRWRLYPIQREVDVLCLATSAVGGLERVSEAEQRVLQLLAEGRTYNEVAAALDVSRTTVERRILSSKRALGAQTVPELMAHVVDAGLVTPSPRPHSVRVAEPCQPHQ